jgi:hypothetical protein
MLTIAGCGLPLGGVGSYPLKYTPGQTYRYTYSTRTALKETIHSQHDVGFTLSATVHLTPVWTGGDVLVVKLEVRFCRFPACR